MQAYGCYDAAAIKREYVRAAFTSAPVEYTVYNKPRDVPVEAEEVVLGRKYVTEWDDEQLRLVSELVSKLLGVVACSVSARAWMLAHFSNVFSPQHDFLSLNRHIAWFIIHCDQA